jgi:CBS domain-containing protein
MTGNYDLLVPAMLVCILAFTLGRKTQLYEKQLPSRLDAPSKMGNMARAILRRLTVQDALDSRRDRELVTVAGDTPFTALTDLHFEKGLRQYPVVDEAGRLTGVVDDEDLRALMPDHAVDSLLIAEDMQQAAQTVTPRQTILAVVNLMARAACDAVVVLDDEESGRPLAVLDRADVVDAYNRQISAVEP